MFGKLLDRTDPEIIHATDYILSNAKDAEGGCLIYGKPNKYYTLWVGGKRIGAHRLVLTMKSEQSLEGLTVDHLCSQKACVNPDHLEAITLEENQSRQGAVMPTKHSNSGKLLRPRYSWFEVQEALAILRAKLEPKEAPA